MASGGGGEGRSSREFWGVRRWGGDNSTYTETNPMARLGLEAARGDLLCMLERLNAGDSINAVDGPDARTALHMAAAAGQNASLEWLLDRGADFSISSRAGSTPLHLAAWNGHDETCLRLLYRAPDLLDVRNASGHTALHWAAAHGHSTVIEVLVRQGADVCAVNGEGEAPLTLAARGGHEDVVVALLKCPRCRPDQPDHLGNTALHGAALSGHAQVLSHLVEAGASHAARNRQGFTARDCLEMLPRLYARQEETLAYLRGFG